MTKGDLGESFDLSAWDEMPVVENYRAVPANCLCGYKQEPSYHGVALELIKILTW